MRFAIRDLLWATVVCSVAAASYHYHQKQIAAVKIIEGRLHEANNTIETMRHQHAWFWREGKYADAKYDFN